MSDAHANALKAYLTAALPGTAEALDLDEIKKRTTEGTLPSNYVEVYLAPRFGGNVRGDMRETSLRRFSTRVVAYSVTNGRIYEDAIADAFRFAMVDLGDVRVHLAYESGGGAFEYDEGKYVGVLTDWTFSI